VIFFANDPENVLLFNSYVSLFMNG